MPTDQTRGLRTRWDVGPRERIEGVDNNGRPIVRLGKNGGPVIRQRVEKHLIPKDAS